MTADRNDLLHSVVARELDGEAGLQDVDKRWRRLPTVQELDELRTKIEVVVEELNLARLEGFLAEALEARGKGN